MLYLVCTDKLFSTFKDAEITRETLFIDEGNAGTLCIYRKYRAINEMRNFNWIKRIKFL